MKVLLASLLILSAALAGCAARTPQSGSQSQSDISRLLDKRIVDCSLPFMNTHDISHADVRYEYLDGAVAFHTQPGALSDHLGQCAAPLTGPRAAFKGRIEIWPANAS